MITQVSVSVKLAVLNPLSVVIAVGGQVKVPPRLRILAKAGIGVQLSEHAVKGWRGRYHLPDEIVYMYKRLILLGEGAGGQAYAAIMPAQAQPPRETVGCFFIVCLDAGVVPGSLYLP